MSPSHDLDWLKDRLDREREEDDLFRAEMREEWKTLRERSHQHASALMAADARSVTAGDNAKRALAELQEHRAHHGLEEGQRPRPLVATSLALAWHYPRAALIALGVWVTVPTALALALVLLAGPGGGLRILLQQAGLRTIVVPPPSATAQPTVGSD